MDEFFPVWLCMVLFVLLHDLYFYLVFFSLLLLDQARVVHPDGVPREYPCKNEYTEYAEHNCRSSKGYFTIDRLCSQAKTYAVA